MPAAQNDPPSLPIGHRIRTLRHEQSVTLAQLAQATGLSEATLSRIETGRSDISAQKLCQVAARLGVDVASFFSTGSSTLAPCIRSIARRGAGPIFETPRFASEVLCADVTSKAMQPFINTITVSTLQQAGGCQGHGGEEFLHVLSGRLELHTSLYPPVLLETGDSQYFDGAMPHAYVNAGREPARILVINSQEQPPANPIFNNQAG